MTPIFADAINFSFVFGLGFAVLVPLMAFEIVVETLVLSRVWRRPVPSLWRFVFFANLFSLVAGIPVKIINSYLYGAILPKDLPSYFSAYPSAVALGSFIYFAITVLVEGFYALRSRCAQDHPLSKSKIWTGILLANISTYIVLAPLNYFFTRPSPPSVHFTRDAQWSSFPKTTLLFVDSKNGSLRSVNIDGSGRRVLVPHAVRDYLVSSNFNLCLYRGADNNLYFQGFNPATNVLVWQTTERFRMDQVAFSPSGRRVAYASSSEKAVVLLDLNTNQRHRQPLTGYTNALIWPSLVWTTSETNLLFKAQDSSPTLAIHLTPDHNLRFESATNDFPLVATFGRVSTGSFWNGHDDWGQSFHSDECRNLQAWCEPGLDSGLVIFSETASQRDRILYLRVNAGLLHLAAFYFSDVSFLDDCSEVIFQTKGFIYLLDIKSKRLATLTPGDRPALPSRRFSKTLSSH